MTETGTLDPGAVFIFGVTCFAFALGVQFGRWSLLLLMRKSWRAQQLRQLANPGREVRPYARAEHAGQYVDRDRVRAGVCGLDLPSFRAR